jgi:thiamine monophosphate synthase
LRARPESRSSSTTTSRLRSALNADGVHLGRSDQGKELARAVGLMLGISATSVYEAIAAAEQGANYVGAGPVWPTPSKSDAGGPRSAWTGSPRSARSSVCP